VTILVPDRLQVTVAPLGSGAASYVRVSGDLDITSARPLGLAARQLIETGAAVTYVDLAEVTSLGPALLGFLVQVGSGGSTTGRSLVLCRSSAASRRTIQRSGLDQIAELRPDLPATWPEATTELQVAP
jgi:anti-anti-sigma factor